MNWSEPVSGPRLVFVGSTGGGVLSRLLAHAFVREMTLEVVADRVCGFVEVGRAAGVPAVVLACADGGAFSDALLRRYPDADTIFLSFYTRLFRGAFLDRCQERLFNCHPSLLPAFKGMHGFEDTLASSASFMGCTLHRVDADMDSGSTVIQAALPLDRRLPTAENRHRIFLAQCYTTLQFLRWLREGRLDSAPSGRLAPRSGTYAPSMFSPNLDPDLFEFLGIANELGG